MRSRDRWQTLQRQARFEAFEERLALSAQPLGDFFLDGSERIEQLYGELAPASNDVHESTGVNYVRDTFGFQGNGQTVAIIDSGIAYDHYALGGGIGTGYRVVGGWDFAEGDGNPYDDAPAGFHGTHVAGIVGSDNATYRGVAPEVDLVALRVFDDNGAGYLSWVESALQWVHDNRNAFENPITTVNLSLGTNWNADSVPAWATLEEEFAQLETDGIFISVSAGNAFANVNNTPGLSYPAASPYVVPVASVDNDGSLSYFSQRNSRALAAPGRSITSTVPDYVFGSDGVPNDFGTASGTSMAAPYVAGASVLVREAMEFLGFQNITQDTIYEQFRTTADIIHDAATNADYYRIDVQSALDALMPDDDYGSTVETAYSLGTLTTETSLSGLIGTLDDVDYFTFTAGATGTVSMTVQATYDLDPIWDLVEGNATVDGDAMALDVVAGQTYAVSLGTDDGIGFY
ncbi:MAG: S8 family serine peptidase, partial [Pirellulaceae bacterium]